MTLRELIWDIKILAEQANSESEFDNKYIADKIAKYRNAIALSVMVNLGYIPNKFYQSLGPLEFEKVNSSDDTNVLVTNNYFGKLELPDLIDIKDNENVSLSIRNLMSKGRESFYKEIDIERLVMTLELGRRIDKFNGYYYRYQNNIYIYPYMKDGVGEFLLENPSMGKVYNGTSWNFLTFDDEYPLSYNYAQEIILQILTNDFQILKQQIPDLVNDSQNELKVMKSVSQGS
jgi:hypothetical protein